MNAQTIMNEVGAVGGYLIRKMPEIKTKAMTDFPILITGESGTGKELIAKLIHQLSRRSKKPIHFVNMLAINDGLFESELFGHKKGSFTDANSDRKGIIMECNGGTIVLDEVGNMSLKNQVKLLRWLESGEIKPVGSDKCYKSNVRVIASTNQNLEVLIERGIFKADLYYRLKSMSIKLTPLREDMDTVLDLAMHFVEKNKDNFFDLYGNKMQPPSGSELATLFNQLIEANANCSNFLSGNARELESFVRNWLYKRTFNNGIKERNIVFSSHDHFIESQNLSKINIINESSVESLPPDTLQYVEDVEWLKKLDCNFSNPTQEELMKIKEQLSTKVAEVEKEVIQRSFDYFDGNLSNMCGNLGISIEKLSEKMKKYDITKVISREMIEAPLGIMIDLVVHVENKLIKFLLDKKMSAKNIAEIFGWHINTVYVRSKRYQLKEGN